MVGFEKALGAVEVIKDQIQYRSQSLLNLACDYFRCTVFTYNKKRQRKTDLLAVNNEFQPYDLKCKYVICSGIV